MADSPLTLDIDVLRQWIGKTESKTDHLDTGRARRFQATLDRVPDFSQGQELPPFWQYIYFNEETRASELKADGHEKLGRFLPPVALPRRMWAGGTVTIDRPLFAGETCTKTSTIRDVVLKSGRSGPLCFVTVEHEFSVDGQHRLTERQNIVYRERPAPDSPAPNHVPAPEDATKSVTVTPDHVLLFRYSALIFYGHRIHYDLDYSRDVEGYPGLVIHCPLLAGLSGELGRNQHPEKQPKTMEIRAVSPLFAPTPFHVETREDSDITRTWVRGADGALAMTVDLTFAPQPEDI